MKLDPVTVIFGGVTLTAEPHGVAGFSGSGQSLVFAGTGIRAPSIKTSNRGNDSMPVSFQVPRYFASPAAAGHFARTHFATLKAATAGAGNLDFAYAGGTDRMVGATLQAVSTSGPFDGNRVVVTYSFIGPPIVAV